MDYFNGLAFNKGVITVLGADKNSVIVSALVKHLEKSGTVAVSQNPDNLNKNTDFVILAPDDTDGKFFITHSKEEINEFEKSDSIIGVVDISVMEKRIADVVKGYEHLCEIADISCNETAYPYVIAKAVAEREKYTLLFIDNIDSADKRFLARELAKHLRYGVGIRLINTDNGDIEILCK